MRTFGLGERIVFLPYTGETFESTRQWTELRNLFSEPPSGSAGYAEISLAG